jgi:uncharacterized protein YndB with AHSA1/START domain
MTQKESQAKPRPLGAVAAQPGKHRITLERTYEASLKDIWDLWTTKKGFESWWGPEGFTVKVRKLDLRPGGDLLYDMIATSPPQIEFMKNAGMPLTTEAKLTYSEVEAMRRLAYTHLVDFVPEVEAYHVATVVELHAKGNQIRMVVILDPMHSEEWTDRAVSGMKSQLSKLDRLFRRVEDK